MSGFGGKADICPNCLCAILHGARQIKQKAPAQAGAKYHGLFVEPNQEKTHTRHTHRPPEDGAGSTQKAYAAPDSTQAAFSWLCALADTVGHRAKLPELFRKPYLAPGTVQYCERVRIFLVGMWSGRRLIQIISNAEPANSADSVQTLLKGYKPAIRGTIGSPSVLGAPQIVLRFSGFFDAENGYENPRNQEQKPHGRLLASPMMKNASPTLLFLVLTAGSREGLPAISPNYRTCYAKPAPPHGTRIGCAQCERD